MKPRLSLGDKLSPQAQTDAAPETLTDVIDTVVEEANVEHVSIRDIMTSISRISFTPLLLLPAISLVTPLSGIPLFATAMGMIISLVSLQMILHRDEIWLPEKILGLSVKSKRLRGALAHTEPFAQWLDNRARNRLTFLAEPPFVLVPQMFCLLSGLAMPFLEFIPFSSSLMGLSVALLAFGMLARDGIILLIACIPYIGIGWLVTYFVA